MFGICVNLLYLIKHVSERPGCLFSWLCASWCNCKLEKTLFKNSASYSPENWSALGSASVLVLDKNVHQKARVSFCFPLGIPGFLSRSWFPEGNETCLVLFGNLSRPHVNNFSGDLFISMIISATQNFWKPTTSTHIGVHSHIDTCACLFFW